MQYIEVFGCYIGYIIYPGFRVSQESTDSYESIIRFIQLLGGVSTLLGIVLILKRWESGLNNCFNTWHIEKNLRNVLPFLP